MPVTIERVTSWLGHRDVPGRLRRLDEIKPHGDLRLPEAGMVELLGRLRVPSEVIGEVGGCVPAPDTHPEAWWLLERLHHELTRGVMAPPWPAPLPTDDPLTRYFHLFAFLAAVPHVRERHAERGISDEVTWDTLSDLGLQVDHHLRSHGVGGFTGAMWLWPHFRGGFFRLGRLSYDLWRVGPALPGVGFAEPAVGVHIPALGPLTPEACDVSLEQARDFFARHFPELPCRLATCASWLLDPQLARYLPDDSNIRRFATRFTLLDGWSRPADADVVRYVFGVVPRSLDDLPQQTSVQRAVVEHLRAGGHWYQRLGVRGLFV